mgnify:CR=1 FL=1
MEQNINLILGTKVIRADGLTGVVEKLGSIDPDATIPELPVISYENGTIAMPNDIEPKDFYLLNREVLGNKVDLKDIDSKIEATRKKIDEANEKIEVLQIVLDELRAQSDLLRKQRWRIENTMTPEYAEKLHNTKKQPTITKKED